MIIPIDPSVIEFSDKWQKELLTLAEAVNVPQKAWQKYYPEESELLFSDEWFAERRVSIADLKKLAESDVSNRVLFVAAMMWGRGPKNGRLMPKFEIVSTSVKFEETLKKTDDVWDSMLKQSPENAFVLPEASDLKKFHDGLTLKEKIRAGRSRQLTRSAQGSVIKLGSNAVETANAFRLTARQVMPKDMAEFMTQKFINAKQNDQIAIMKAIDYSIIERYGITGVPGGKGLAEEIINTKYGLANALDETAELPVREDIAQILSKDTIV